MTDKIESFRYYGLIIVMVLISISFLCSSIMYTRVRHSTNLQEQKPTVLSLWVMILNGIVIVSIVYILFFYPLSNSIV